LTSAGGLLVKTSQTLGLKEGSFRIYNEQAATHQMVATVTGVWASDRRPADGKYFILGADGSEYLVTDTRGKGIYRTGEQLIPSRLVVEAGKPAKTITRSLMFEDESPINTLKALKQAYPNAGIYLSGQLTCDDVENLVTRSEVDRYATLTKSEGGTIKLFYHPLEQAIADLTEQYVAGSLTVKIIRPNPIGARE
jgi:inner membrane protein